MRDFLRGRVVLKRVLVLIDSRHGIKDVDREMMQMLDQSAVGYRLVLTKADKIKASELDKDVPIIVSRELATRCSADFLKLPGCGHVGPVLGHAAAGVTEQAAEWHSARMAHRRSASVS